MRLLSLGLADKFFPALGTGDGDFSLAPGNTNHLMALGAVIVAVLPVFQPVEELKEFPVLLIPGIGVSGEGTENGPNHQSVGQGSQQQIDQGSMEKGGDQAGHQADAQDRHIQPVGAITSCHEPLELGSQLGHKLSKHRENSLCENFFSLL